MATKLKSVGDEMQAIDAEHAVGEHNLRIWKVLGKTDPAHTKGFQRAGGFRGTAIKPMWVTQRLTELFGPCGQGWGTEEPQFTTVIGQDGEVLVYCTVAGWYREKGAEHTARVYGVGGDKAVSWVGRDNSRRMVADDEAFKKAFTDALGNAFKFVGVAADIHMGLFDDSKYVAEVQKEFEDADRETVERQKVVGIHKIKERLSKLLTEGNAATDIEAFNALIKAHKDDLKTIRDANHEWWTGDGGDFEGYAAWKDRRKAELTVSTSYRFLASLVQECPSKADLESLLDEYDGKIGELDGEERRLFDLAYNNREVALTRPAPMTAGVTGE